VATVLKKVGGARTPHPETERQSRDASPREPQRRGEEAVEGVHPCARGGKRGEERLSRDVSVFETAVSAGGGIQGRSGRLRPPRAPGRRDLRGAEAAGAWHPVGARQRRRRGPARDVNGPTSRHGPPTYRSEGKTALVAEALGKGGFIEEANRGNLDKPLNAENTRSGALAEGLVKELRLNAGESPSEETVSGH